jgi:hypothetical protein
LAADFLRLTTWLSIELGMVALRKLLTRCGMME